LKHVGASSRVFLAATFEGPAIERGGTSPECRRPSSRPDAGVQGIYPTECCSYPAGDEPSEREWALFECRQRESEMGNEKDRPDGTCRGRSARRRGWEFGLREWRASFRSKRRRQFGAIGLDWLFSWKGVTRLAEVVDRGVLVARTEDAVIRRQDRKSLRRPRIRCDTGALGCALVIAQIKGRSVGPRHIRSWKRRTKTATVRICNRQNLPCASKRLDIESLRGWRT